MLVGPKTNSSSDNPESDEWFLLLQVELEIKSLLW
jgi:hypothetical protein